LHSNPEGQIVIEGAPSRMYPRLRRGVHVWVNGWNRAGRQTLFYGKTLRSVWDAVVHYKVETLRLIAEMGLGTGALAVIGGTVVIVGFLTLSAGSLIALQGYNSLANIGVEALAGFVSAFLNTRLIAPLVAGIGLAATIGAGATAQLGAMRISEEIDALEVMGIRSVAYLASTRLAAGVLIVIPLYCIAVLMSYMACRVATTLYFGQSTGVYDHYFNTFLNPTDLIWSFLQAIAMSIVVMLVHTYYGFNASGGPAGVGEAVGRAVRTSLVAASFTSLFLALAIYGQTGGLHLTG
jgi:phospholipid/cholesterol/gamma-HCH transport system permease protein